MFKKASTEWKSTCAGSGNSKEPDQNFAPMYIHATYDELVKAIGVHHENGGDKTQLEWAFDNESGGRATIYDWKEYNRNITKGDVEWHIGASGKAAQQEFAEWLREKGLKVV